MLKIEKVVKMSPEQYEIVIEGMRNPMNSWDKSDSGICKSGNDGIGCENCAVTMPCTHSYDYSFQLGKNDYNLMMNLVKNGSLHAKYRRMMPIWVTLTAPLYFYKEFDVYKVGTVTNSCSTMHKIQEKEFTLEDFSCEHLIGKDINVLEKAERMYEDKDFDEFWTSYDIVAQTIRVLNFYRKKYLDTKDKEYWWQMIQLLPSSYNQKRTVMLNYEVLANMYHSRKNHKLDEWHTFCHWIETLPYSELIIGDE